jgi:hypothetical protein
MTVETTFGLRNTMDSQLSDDGLRGNNPLGCTTDKSETEPPPAGDLLSHSAVIN